VAGGWGLAALGVAVMAVLVVALVVVLRRHAAETAPPHTDADLHVPGPEGTRRDLRAVPPPGASVPAMVTGVLPRDLAAPPGGLALLQLSSQFCADCRAARAVLTDVAAEVPGTLVREIDVAMRPELVRLLGIRRTPTVLVVDPAGVELARRVGVPRRADLLATLQPLRPTG